MSTDPGVIAGDHIIGAMIVPTDAGAGIKMVWEALTQEGITFGTVNEIAENLSGTVTIWCCNLSGIIKLRKFLLELQPFTATAVATFNTNARGPEFFI
jgi:hypothetical protein